MAKAVFFSIPAHGHINPTLPLVEELIRSGDEVAYYSTFVFKEKIEATGAKFREYRSSAHFDTTKPGKSLGFFYYTLSKVSYGLLDELISDLAELAPDYVIHDAACLWGRIVASILNIPAVSSTSTFAFSKGSVGSGAFGRFLLSLGVEGLAHILKAQSIQRKLEAKYGVAASNFLQAMMNVEGLNIVYTSRLLQPHAQEFDETRFKFVGPSIAERSGDPDAADYATMERPLIYVSLGTIWKDEAAVNAVIDALAGLPYTLVVSSPDSRDHHPDNSRIIVKSHINQLEVLKYADVFITHGGMNSVSEALYRGVPMCVHPFQAEQEQVASRVLELRCGVRIKRFGGEDIRRAVATVLRDRTYKDNCNRVAESLKEAGGFKKAAEYIHNYVRTMRARGS